MRLHKSKYNFSLQQLSLQRLKFQHKMCFKPSLNHLRLKTTPAIAVGARLFRDGNFLRVYKQLQRSFQTHLLPQVSKLAPNNEFKNLYARYRSFRDINRVLFWKILSVNSLFNVKKLKKKRIIYYLKPERRLVLVLFFLKNLTKLRKKNFKNLSPVLFESIFKFICANRSHNEVFSLKLKIYKLRLVRG